LIYLDTSVVLARLFAEGLSPPDVFWSQTSVSSRLLEFEVFNRVRARNAGASYAADARHFVDRVNLLELSAPVLARALLPFPLPVRTLDALHLASMEFLRGQGQALELASYDLRLSAAAMAIRIQLAEL